MGCANHSAQNSPHHPTKMSRHGPLPAPSKALERAEQERTRMKLAEALGQIYTRAPGTSGTLDNKCVGGGTRVEARHR